MNPEDQSDMIERYLFNRMTEEERVSFELLMKDDPTLFEEVKIQKDMLDAASDKDFQTIFPHLEQQNKAYQESLKKSPKNMKKGFLVVLVFALLILLYFISQYLF